MVIGGSTASGKSALALALAEATGGTIVNADSQQLFADLPILTARPTAADTSRAPHRLYGVLGPHEQPSVGRWLAGVEPVLAELAGSGRPAILTGGTGLYLHALLAGLAPIPPVPPAVRADVLAESHGAPGPVLHDRLAALDPRMAARLEPGDRQRILRAIEIVRATGRSLLDWQEAPQLQPRTPPLRLGVALLPPAEAVAPRIAERLARMLDAGAAEEVADLARRVPDLAQRPIAKVHGCRELLAVHEGRLDRAAAMAWITAQIRQYAKRQRTFFRHRLPQLLIVDRPGETPSLAAELLALLKRS